MKDKPHEFFIDAKEQYQGTPHQMYCKAFKERNSITDMLYREVLDTPSRIEPELCAGAYDEDRDGAANKYWRSFNIDQCQTEPHFASFCYGADWACDRFEKVIAEKDAEIVRLKNEQNKMG